ncbi:integrase core domain-containing protein [Streptomyces sp. NBC_01433]|uniref:integrase core domain-containing protein n=1 Tax=Streptomyces sp. NBC_01433 TaxID=2903864 RepID=UPI0022576040|nr:integrase core domain-containing protein [Streptomyces sp. NBC_01433]MCX4677409.1 integrase core domain-containing protein [Streptomyces sp. NBC_01433]
MAPPVADLIQRDFTAGALDEKWCGIRRSMGRVGSSFDNALAESFRQGRNRETMYGKLFVTMRHARLGIFRWLTYYNARRRHSALVRLSPDGVRTEAPQDS